ncbi:hypothetical protein [Paenibacillus sophorae]|nr:hypothetical protein [Paenibacillus sophorae]QWU15705.1 hypothetical protein KP014_28480 [Paenibacillus sophorae]
MKKFLLRLMPMGIESAKKRRQKRMELAYQIMLEHQVRDLKTRLDAAEDRLQEIQANKNDMFSHLCNVSTVQHNFIEARGLKEQYVQYAESVRKEKVGAAI